MELAGLIPVQQNPHSKLAEVNFAQLEFGKYVADHMLVCEYSHGTWHTPHIVPYANLSMAPTTLALHYGQTVFEGMKAFRMKDGRINIFRMDRHYDRFRRSLERMCMAVPPKEVFVEGLIQLISLDNGWVPSKSGDALYIRPFVYASEGRFGVKVSEEYQFVVSNGPVPSLYANPIKVKVETQYSRAAKGSTGFAKCGGNYGGAFYPTALARQEGFEQVIWTDSIEHRYIEESGMMNAMFVIDGKLVTPPLSDSILDGITRDSLLTVAKDLGIETAERKLSIDELEACFRNKTITEAFGAGTAAVVAPIKLIHINGIDYELPAYDGSTIHNRLKVALEEIRTGVVPDVHGWNTILD